MIHQIKALYNQGQGLSIRKIADQLEISRNTVSKYLKLDETEIAALQQRGTKRKKELDDYRDYIIHLLQSYPGLSAVKIQRKLQAKASHLTISGRSIRRYIQALKQEITLKQKRYFEPVLDMVPGEQCQVDGGELRGVRINGVETTVYFMVFVLSYSRLMHVSVSAQPIDTEKLIRQHDAAFRYFGGMPQECVYDQTKLVVISETFRELQLNSRFSQYATAAGFRIRVCEGYDPQSKGKVEAGVKYVKHNGLYGESFGSWAAMEAYCSDWLKTIANQRLHGVTQKRPAQYYQEQEQAHMRPYLTPDCVERTVAEAEITRQVDKTGLIAWQGNKYSVPYQYQQARVAVMEKDGDLLIHDLATHHRIAKHTVRLEKGQIIKQADHYRDQTQTIKQLEQDIDALVKEQRFSQPLCALLKQTSPTIYKHQLRGMKQILGQSQKQGHSISEACWQRVLKRPKLTATGFRDMVEAWQQPPCQEQADSAPQRGTALNPYDALNGQSADQGAADVHP